MWYLPRYPVKHSLKPGKGEAGSWLCSKVWTIITSSWWHRSNVSPLNEPKRLRHFFNLLIFVWWPNRELAKEMQEYRMVKHLFGSTSSPSVANVCPRKTAQLNQEGFDAKVEATRKEGCSQTLEQDEASFERWRREPLGGGGGLGACLPRKFWNQEAQKCSSKHFSWHYSSEKSILNQNQDEGIASSCLMLATALWSAACMQMTWWRQQVPQIKQLI